MPEKIGGADDEQRDENGKYHHDEDGKIFDHGLKPHERLKNDNHMRAAIMTDQQAEVSKKTLCPPAGHSFI